MAHQQVALYLLQGIQHNADDDQQGGSTKELGELLTDTCNSCESRHNGDNSKKDCSWQCDSIHDHIEIIFGLLTWFDTWYKAIVSL